ncbi:ABC-F family ATP-binding cassette domain-containing protein [Haloglycomyces albus]|uniref:ABC-F family ATP-binding cassette domain-containing protein n=1 Tax=Haloglycomyces albus TaxID=526067 RepID=UPI00046CBC71|nr:ATP-binding cassette domain-containing protein [Haloglycomyces albus]
MLTTVAAHRLSFSWPDGTSVFSNLDMALSHGVTALIGDNGSGKSTLLEVVAGLRPAGSGHVERTGRIAYVPQHQSVRSAPTVAHLLGVADVFHALAAVESGQTDAELFDRIGDDWDIVERTHRHLDRLGLGHIEPTRATDGLSGGERTLVALAGRLLQRPDILLLDEPSNNLDATARGYLYRAIETFGGTVLVVSHDRELLDRVDTIAELRSGRLRTFKGNFADYRRAIETEQNAIRRDVRDATAHFRKQKQEWIEAQTKLARRERTGRKRYNNAAEPRAVMRERQRAAQVSGGKHRIEKEDDLSEAKSALEDTKDRLRDDTSIRIDLPETHLAPSALAVRLNAWARHGVYDGTLTYGPDGVDLDIVGPERIAISGDNGSGKTTLVNELLQQSRVTAGYLTQTMDLPLPDGTVLDNVRHRAPDVDQGLLRTRLSRFHLRRRSVFRPVSTLSGGERLRTALATVLSAEPPPRLLVLDEPTNNLDLTSVEQLRQALSAFEGALVVISHDQAFVDGLGVTRRIHLERNRGVVSDVRGGVETVHRPAEPAANNGGF